MAFVSVSGAKSSVLKPRYDLIERGFLRRLAERLGYGAEMHGERNYRQGVMDSIYHRDRVNHLIEHALKYADGDTSTDHLAAIAANCNILAYLDDHQESGVFINSERPRKLNSICPCAQGDGDTGESAVGGEPV